jgi:pimeloyl-ACP methyl ester carboxylesterase
MHGLFGSGRNWRNVAAKLVEVIPTLDVHLLDMRNHGTPLEVFCFALAHCREGSSQHSSVMSFEVMTSDVAQYIRKLPKQKALVMGHSMVRTIFPHEEGDLQSRR